jgi:hypothetical protein
MKHPIDIHPSLGHRSAFFGQARSRKPAARRQMRPAKLLLPDRVRCSLFIDHCH